MWCSNCQQDVPGIATSELPPNAEAAVDEATEAAQGEESPDSEQTARFYCARCGEALTTGAPDEDSSQEENDKERDPYADVRFEAFDWELDQELHDVSRLLPDRAAALTANALVEIASLPDREDQEDVGEFDELEEVLAAEKRTPELHAPCRRRAESSRRTRPESTESSPVASLIMLLGVMGISCGGVLLGWSFHQQRPDLWTLGMPVGIGGQALLLLGIAVSIVTMIRSHRAMAEHVQEVDQRLDEVARQNRRAAAFRDNDLLYAHLAEGLHPHLLLKDARGRLDLLADNLTRR